MNAADDFSWEERAATTDGHRVNIAGRNRMLPVRLTKLFVLRDWHVCDEEALALMELSRREFEMNIAELGASCADVPEAAAQLQVVGDHWQHFTAAIDMIPARNRKNTNASAVIAAGETLLRHADATVKMYERMAE